MYLSELSAELNIPVQALKSFLASKNIEATVHTNLSNDEERIIRDNLEEIRQSVEVIKLDAPEIEGPKIVSKIDLSAIDSSTRPKKGLQKGTDNKNTPWLFSAAQEFNIKSEELIEFLASKGFNKEDLGVAKRLTEEMYKVAKDHYQSTGISTIKLEGPKILGKIELPVDNDTRPQRTLTTPRLMSAAKEFNIGKDTLVDHLVSKGFDRDDLKPTAKLTPEMYLSLVERFQPDRLAKLKSELINLPVSRTEERNHWKGIIDSEQPNGRVKIHFIRHERTYKNGKPVVVEKPDTTRWTFALREHWGDYNFIPGEKIFFSIEQIDRGDRKVRVAMPPKENISKAVEEDQHENEEKGNEKDVIQVEEQVNTIPTNKEDNNPINESKMNTSVSPLQKILFGSPGTGKSFQIVDAENSYFRQLIVDSQKPDLIKTVFHPEYTYGDFMGKLMPLTNRGKVEYRYYSGHFMLALGTAYKNIIRAYIEYVDKVDEIEKDFKAEKRKNKSDYTEEEKAELQQRISEVQKPKPKNVLLVIDEINRGNSAAIFGTVFQLLDRDNAGWSSYPVKISDLELQELLNVTGLYYVREGSEDEVGAKFCGKKIEKRKYDEYVQAIFTDLEEDKKINILENNIKMPPNLSIVATMNTSDNSIYFMDSAFKRRWDWEFVDITSEEQKTKQSGRTLEDGFSWDEFVDNLNEFIKKYGERIRKIEDKQIGYYFIKGDVIKHEAIRNKLMFFLWDSIFNNDKKPIKELIGMDKTLVTFGDFIKHYQAFIEAIKNKSFTKNVL
jgi:5-methylcytosine-specific restriction enzyme B